MVRQGLKTVSRLFVLCGLSLFLTGVTVHAEPVQWPGNGHWYDAIDFPSTWVDAFKDARIRSYLDLPGHLATLTSQEENDFVAQTFQVLNSYWLGGFQRRRATEVDRGWRWITREPWSFTNWSGAEPNDSCGISPGVEDGEENLLQLLNGAGAWNDMCNDAVLPGYIIEYEERTAQESVPEAPPATHPQRKLTTTWADIKRAR
ncbi:hypothetical protein HYR99_32330 [Candidatus Poribacteria bacterium]|nr:hypothetical protein [Candidatus Poribacteria bacterium]